jgi:putative transposase
VTTEAKRTPDRAWLAEVSAVVLQQSVADLHHAYRNYCAALAEVKAERATGNKQAKLRVYRPTPKRRHHDQAIRFTANSRFRVLPNGRLRLPKVGDLRVRWSRELPSTPSSVTITLDGAGRYHASFVVQVQETPLPSTQALVGIDLGLTHFATLSTGEKVTNPCWLRQRQKVLRRAQRSLSRRQEGSKNRDKQRRKVAKLHARVAAARRDFHHQLSTRLVREHQAVMAEDLNVAGLGARTWPSRSTMPGGRRSSRCWRTRRTCRGGGSSRSIRGPRRPSSARRAGSGVVRRDWVPLRSAPGVA